MTSENNEKTSKLGMSHKQITIWSVIVSLITLSGLGYYLYTKYYPSTDDAYVQANVVDIAPQVSGPVSVIYVRNNQYVKKGQKLFDIDARPFVDAAAKAAANLQLAQQSMEADVSQVQVSLANLNKALANLDNSENNYRRITTLVKKKQASISSGDQATADYKSSIAAVVASTNQVNQVMEQLGNIGDRNAQILQAKANLHNAKLNLAYTHIIAPADGYLANFKLRVGNMASAHQVIFELVEEKLWWIDANFKETQMARIKPNQMVSVSVDMYPNHKYKAYVQSISRGSGSIFSLLPPENASGNWVKVTQRFPVKIVILNPSTQYPLRMGASSEVTINTTKYIKPPKLPALPQSNLENATS